MGEVPRARVGRTVSVEGTTPSGRAPDPCGPQARRARLAALMLADEWPRAPRRVAAAEGWVAEARLVPGRVESADGRLDPRLRPPPHPPSTGARSRGGPPPPGRRGAAALARRPGRDRRPDAALPYWAFAWAGGLAIGRYLREHPEVVAGRRVFDLASGSGLCAIAALHAGAAAATGADIDRFAAAAIGLNARANGRRVAVVRRDVLDEEPPEVDVILAGDCWYDAAPRRARPAVAAAGARPRDRRPGRRSRPPPPAARRAGRARRRTRSARRPSSRTSSASRAASSGCVPDERLGDRPSAWSRSPMPRSPASDWSVRVRPDRRG